MTDLGGLDARILAVAREIVASDLLATRTTATAELEAAQASYQQAQRETATTRAVLESSIAGWKRQLEFRQHTIDKLYDVIDQQQRVIALLDERKARDEQPVR